MQEQNESKSPSLVARIGIRNLIWLGIFGALLLAVATTWLWSYRTLPTATWRELNDTLPWTSEGLRVESVKGQWKSAAGNERMMLRTAYYPEAEIELGESEGSGMLYIIFTDSNGRQAGDTISLYYNKGVFNTRKELNIDAEGNKARVFVEAGYDDESYFTLHQIDESSPLWRVNLRLRPEGAHNMRHMGCVTIPVELRK